MSKWDTSATTKLRVMALILLILLPLTGPFLMYSTFNFTVTNPVTGFTRSTVNWSLFGTGIATMLYGVMT